MVNCVEISKSHESEMRKILMEIKQQNKLLNNINNKNEANKIHDNTLNFY
jgi:hypothetical protein